MKRETAEKIMGIMKTFDALLGNMCVVVEEIEDVDEKKYMRGVSYDLVVDAHEKIAMKIVKQFPDLHPDRGKM